MCPSIDSDWKNPLGFLDVDLGYWEKFSLNDVSTTCADRKPPCRIHF